MDEVLLDTDILSEILKAKDTRVLDVAGRYLVQHQRFAFSAFTLYEILRGFRANQGRARLTRVSQARCRQRRSADLRPP